MNKRKSFICLILVLALTLCGCMGTGMIPNPEVMADGSAWEDSWVNVGGRLGVEPPAEPFALLTTNGRLEEMSLYYATWVCGEEQEVDKDTYVYDGQIYLMTESCETPEDAAQTLSEWRSRLSGDFAVTDEQTFTAGGVAFTLVFYDCLAEDSHFSRGVTALGLQDNLVLVADIACVETLELDLQQTAEDFLLGIYYA